MVRAWYFYEARWLVPAPDMPADWPGPLARAPAPDGADTQADA